VPKLKITLQVQKQFFKINLAISVTIAILAILVILEIFVILGT